MTKLTNFDVLIVYAQSIAVSASDPKNVTPFAPGSRNETYNTVYGYFLETCHAQNLTAAFTTSADIVGPGFCKSFWTYENGAWHKNNSPCYSSLIFDKFSPTSVGTRLRRQLLFSDPQVKPFNDPTLFSLFFDKQLTYNQLFEHAIPTFTLIDTTLAGITKTCRELENLMLTHAGTSDFNSDIIMKDRFGAGGRRVYKFTRGQLPDMHRVANRNSRISYIIQPFAIFDRGFTFEKCPGSTDIRLIYLKGEIVQSYIRMAKAGDFRCNEHQGGLLTYLSITKIPKSLIKKSNDIANKLNKKCSLFALDFIITNSGQAYLLEGNTGPGLDWNMSLIKNENEAKKLIQLIVLELGLRSTPHVIYRSKISKKISISPPTVGNYPQSLV